MAELIEMRFGTLSRVGPGNMHYMGCRWPQGKGHFSNVKKLIAAINAVKKWLFDSPSVNCSVSDLALIVHSDAVSLVVWEICSFVIVQWWLLSFLLHKPNHFHLLSATFVYIFPCWPTDFTMWCTIVLSTHSIGIVILSVCLLHLWSMIK